MKKLIFPLLLASAAALNLAADKASLNGQWQVHSSIAGNDNDQSCTFKQNDNELTGECTSTANGTVTIAGKIDGKKVNWSYKSDYNGSPLTVQFAGIVDSANQIKGTVTVPEFSVDGDFTASPSK